MRNKHNLFFSTLASAAIILSGYQGSALARPSSHTHHASALHKRSLKESVAAEAQEKSLRQTKTTSGKTGSDDVNVNVSVGKASYYGNRFHGKKTADGGKFDKMDFTAAHRTLPFGTLVKVTNLKNGKKVVVKINDRGPYNRSRIIDLSKAAAMKLGIVNSGIGKVRIESYN